MIKHLLLIPHIKIHNANAFSSPYTIGFPAMTAWLGAVHALQRHLNQNNFGDIRFNKTAVSCHHFDMQTYKGPNDFIHSIVGTANPLDKDGNRPAFIEEARCHLDVSLLIECHGLDPREDIIQTIVDVLRSKMKIAGGDILDFGNIEYYSVNEDNEFDIQSLLRKLMPGYVLIERRDLLKSKMTEENNDALTALLHYLKIKHRAEEENNSIKWTTNKEITGWIIPIAVGFQGISEIAHAKNQRDATTPHRFAESVVTLGEFVMPYRIQNLDDILWQYHVDLEKNLYLCQNQNTTID